MAYRRTFANRGEVKNLHQHSNAQGGDEPPTDGNPEGAPHVFAASPYHGDGDHDGRGVAAAVSVSEQPVQQRKGCRKPRKSCSFCAKRKKKCSGNGIDKCRCDLVYTVVQPQHAFMKHSTVAVTTNQQIQNLNDQKQMCETRGIVRLNRLILSAQGCLNLSQMVHAYRQRAVCVVQYNCTCEKV